MEALRRDAASGFQGRLVEHLKTQFPAECLAHSPADLVAHIHFGIDRARHHGLDTEQQLAFYLDLTLLFGRNFDIDQVWAAQVLASGYDGDTRIEKLYQKSVKYLSEQGDSRTNGPEGGSLGRIRNSR